MIIWILTVMNPIFCGPVVPKTTFSSECIYMQSIIMEHRSMATQDLNFPVTLRRYNGGETISCAALGAFTRQILARLGPCVHTGNRSLNLGSNFEPSLAQVEHRVTVLNQFLSRPHLSNTCPPKLKGQ